MAPSVAWPSCRAQVVDESLVVSRTRCGSSKRWSVRQRRCYSRECCVRQRLRCRPASGRAPLISSRRVVVRQLRAVAATPSRFSLRSPGSLELPIPSGQWRWSSSPMRIASSGPSVTCPSSFGDLAAGRPGQEHDDPSARVRVGERVRGDDRREVVVRPRQDADVEPELSLDGALRRCGATPAGIPVATEDDVAALEIGLDVLAAQRRVQRAQARHRDQVVPTDVDAAQERDVAVRHALDSTTLRRRPIRGRDRTAYFGRATPAEPRRGWSPSASRSRSASSG